MGPFKRKPEEENDILPAVDFSSPGAVKENKIIENWKLFDYPWMIQYWKYENKNFPVVKDIYATRKIVKKLKMESFL